MNKKLPVPQNTNKVSEKSLQPKEKELAKVIKQTNEQIKEGLEKKTASTGTPIDDLHGMAKSLAIIANVGGGSVESGGGGVKTGTEALLTNAVAKSELKGIREANTSNNKKLK